MSQNTWLHRYAIFLAFSTIFLIFAGGMVTSTGSGLSVPDWPLSYGQLFPPMVGGIFYEHGHRMIAATVGLLTIIMAVWLWRVETRKWLRYLGLIGLLAVVFQGTLGGLTVLFLLPTAISVSHAAVAQAFLGIMVSIAVFTSRAWKTSSATVPDASAWPMRTWTKVLTVSIFVQTILGAVMRHTASGLAIPDWPLSFGRLVPPEFTGPVLVNFAHRTWGLAVAAAGIALAIGVMRRHAETALRVSAVVLLLALCFQVMLGGLTVWSGKAEIPTTFHVAGGAFVFACSLVLSLISHRLLVPQVATRTATVVRAGMATE